MKCISLDLILCGGRTLICNESVVIVYKDVEEYLKNKNCVEHTGEAAIEGEHDVPGVGVVRGNEVVRRGEAPIRPYFEMRIPTKIIIALYRIFGQRNPDSNVYLALQAVLSQYGDEGIGLI